MNVFITVPSSVSLNLSGCLLVYLHFLVFLIYFLYIYKFSHDSNFVTFKLALLTSNNHLNRIYTGILHVKISM